MQRWIIAGVLATALLASACAGSSSDASGADTQASTNVDATSGAQALITRLGTDDAAADALIIAMDRGYSGSQILAAVEDGTLRSDGTVDGQSPDEQPLGLVVYDVGGAGEGAVGDGPGSAEITLVAYFQIEQTPIERLRQNATRNLGVGEPATEQILRLLKARFTPADIVEALILGIDGSADYPDDPDSPISCIIIVDELICPGGERFPVPIERSLAPEPASEASPSADAEPEPAKAPPMQLFWEGDLSPDTEFVDNPVSGTFAMSRADGTDDFEILLATADAKSGTFTTDGFNEVECTSEWSSVFEGTGTFWDVNNLGIEFTGQITRSIVYTAGPCDENPTPETSDFSGVVVFITDSGIETSFNAWSITLDGPAPVPVG